MYVRQKRGASERRSCKVIGVARIVAIFALPVFAFAHNSSVLTPLSNAELGRPAGPR